MLLIRKLPAYALLALGVLLSSGSPLFGQNNNCGFFNRQVGGVLINAEGVIADTTPADRAALLDELKGKIAGPAPALAKASKLRYVSLRGLEAAVRESIDTATPPPEEIRYLSGIQRIQYVFVVPERSDVVLAGPGEGWRVDDAGNVVGDSTGLPVLQLADLIIALRNVGQARDPGISCSIDPTAEGRRAFQAVLGKQKQFTPAILETLEKAMGPQEISLGGIPADCHFAHVLVAADYRMKRLAMGLDKSPIAGLPSYVELLKTKRGKVESATPRWWLSCNYEPLLRSEDGGAWEIRGAGVKALTEDDVVDGGGVKGSGGKSPLAGAWAENFTAKYGEVSMAAPVFGELRNLMDLCVVAALIEHEKLLEKAKCHVPELTNSDSAFRFATWHTPKAVSTQCGFLKSGRDYIITASGGVQIDSFAVVAKSKIEERVGQVREKSPKPADGAWWWQ